MFRKRLLAADDKPLRRPQPTVEPDVEVVLALQPLCTAHAFLPLHMNCCAEGWARFGTVCRGFWLRMVPMPTNKKQYMDNMKQRSTITHGFDPRVHWQVEPRVGTEELIVGESCRAAEWLRSVIDEATASDPLVREVTFLIPEPVSTITMLCLKICDSCGLNRPYKTRIVSVDPCTEQCSFHSTRKNANGKPLQCMRVYVAGRVLTRPRLDRETSCSSDSEGEGEPLDIQEDVTPAYTDNDADAERITTF